jgi:hypothetical protein
MSARFTSDRLVLQEIPSSDVAYALVPHLHPSDVLHIAALCGGSAGQMGEYVQHALDGAQQAFTICDKEDRILGIWAHDHYDLTLNTGEVCLLSTVELWETHFREMTRIFRSTLIPKLCAAYDRLVCTVRADNTDLLRWLEKAGFEQGITSRLHDERFVQLTYTP